VSSTSSSVGETADGLGAAAVRELAARHGIHPTKALGQHFLIDPNLARAIAADAGVGPGSRVVEVGAGLGSLTLALAAAGAAEVRAVEFDRALMPALAEVTAGLPNVELVARDVMRLDWERELGTGGGPWTLCANLPYNISVPLVMTVLEAVPSVTSLVVMVQKEVGERLAAAPDSSGYGAVSVKVAYRARASVVRKVPPEVFWPRPRVASVVVRLERLAAPPVTGAPDRLWRVVDEGFAERRKTMRNALRRLGLTSADADAALEAAGVKPNARAEQLSLATFAAIADQIRA
jgi:16S rRNA (adenine1518-N6/adenine1519-N6)-dimethyltransferase